MTKSYARKVFRRRAITLIAKIQQLQELANQHPEIARLNPSSLEGVKQDLMEKFSET